MCKMLGLKSHNKVIDDIKSRFKQAKALKRGKVGTTHLFISKPNKDGILQRRKRLVINKEMLFALILRSKKEKAIIFQAWVIGEVLLAIYKYGEYRTNSKIIRKSLTDTIRDEIPASPNKSFKYKHFTELAYKLAFDKSTNELKEIHGDKIRDKLSKDDLKSLFKYENVITSLIEVGKNYEEIKEVLTN